MNKKMFITMQLIWGISSLFAIDIDNQIQATSLNLESENPYFHLSTEIYNLIQIKEVRKELSILKKRDEILSFFIGLIKNPTLFSEINPEMNGGFKKKQLYKMLKNKHTIKHMISIIEKNIGWTIIERCELIPQKIYSLRCQSNEKLDAQSKREFKIKFIKQFHLKFKELNDEQLEIVEHSAIVKACEQFIEIWLDPSWQSNAQQLHNTNDVPTKTARL